MLCAKYVHIGIMYLFQPSWPNSDESGFVIALHFFTISYMNDDTSAHRSGRGKVYVGLVGCFNDHTSIGFRVYIFCLAFLGFFLFFQIVYFFLVYLFSVFWLCTGDFIPIPFVKHLLFLEARRVNERRGQQ